MKTTSLTVDELNKRYPDEWILLGNPVESENGLETFAGVPLFHSKDKREVCYLGRQYTTGYDLISLYFSGTTLKQNRRVMLGPLKRVNQ